MRREDEFKHLNAEASKKAQVCLKQARRCEQFTIRLEMLALKTANATHSKLNRDAINAITKHVDEDEGWQTDLAFALMKKDRNQAENTLLIPMLKNSTKHIMICTRNKGQKHFVRRRMRKMLFTK